MKTTCDRCHEETVVSCISCYVSFTANVSIGPCQVLLVGMIVKIAFMTSSRHRDGTEDGRCGGVSRSGSVTTVC